MDSTRSAAGTNLDTPTGIASGTGLLDIAHRTTCALQAVLVRHPQHPDRMGWSQDLGDPAAPSPWSTALGLRTLQMLDGTHAVDVASLLRTLVSRQNDDGGWPNRIQLVSRPESTAAVLDVLSRVGAEAEVINRGWSWLEGTLSHQDRHRPFVLATLLDHATAVRPDSSLVTAVAGDLVKLARPDGTWSANPRADAPTERSRPRMWWMEIVTTA